MSFQQIDIASARQLLKEEAVTVLDIRDAGSFSAGHIKSAIHAEAVDIDAFVADEDKNKPLLVYCYHGISSRGAAEYFTESGFARVYSLDGGYVAWSESQGTPNAP